jgi:glycosyltransferase involved in cell wall biosynthesis
MTSERGRGASSSKPISVILDMTFPDRNAGGSGVYARSLLDSLRRRDDVAPGVIASPEHGPHRTLHWLAVGARRALLSTRTDLLHCPAYVAPWRSPLPLVITMHDAASMRFPGDYPIEWRVFNRLFLPGAARRARAVITGTRTSRADLSRYYRIRRSRIYVTPYGIDDRYHSPIDAAAIARERSGLCGPAGEPLILFPSAPLARKNLDIVLRALAAAPPDSPLARARLAISGATESSFRAYVEMISRLGLHGRVAWLGRVDVDRMPLVFAAADLVVNPSLYEGFGLPPLEAMAVGTPVLASTAPCLPEVAGDSALLVDPNDLRGFIAAAEAVLTRPELRARLVSSGKQRAAAHTWERCAEETCRVYRRVLLASGRASSGD